MVLPSECMDDGAFYVQLVGHISVSKNTHKMKNEKKTFDFVQLYFEPDK